MMFEKALDAANLLWDRGEILAFLTRRDEYGWRYIDVETDKGWYGFYNEQAEEMPWDA